MKVPDRARLVFHGAIVLLVGLLCGYPTVVESLSSPGRLWHTAHEALLMIGIWLLATSSVLATITLDRRDASALVWSLIATGYGFMIAVVTQAITGVEAFEPGHSPGSIVAFSGSAVGILGALLATLLTLKGAGAAIKGARSE
jgi:hypothetical protein